MFKVVLIVIFLVIKVSECAVQQSCRFENNTKSYYDNFVDDYEPCPTIHINQTCKNVAGAEARMNCFKCCQSKLHVLHALVLTNSNNI